MRCLRTWLLAAAACQLPLQAAEASPLPAGAFLRACKIVVPEQTPLFPGSPAQAADAETADDESDDGDDDDEDEDDAEDESVPGFISPGTGTCVAVSGVLSLGAQSDSFRASPLTRATGLVPPNGLSHPGSLSFRIETAKTLASGLYLASAFEISFDRATDPASGAPPPTIAEASVTIGPFVFGIADSRYDFWSGDDFVFSTRVPSRTVGLIGYERVLWPDLKFSLSAEDTQIDPARALPGGSGLRTPDGVVRLLYEGEALTLHAAAAVRDVPRAPGVSARMGRAALLGMTYEAPVLGKTTSFTAQISGAVDAAPYIGSSLDLRTLRQVITGTEATRGWSGVLALGRDWSEEISSHVFVSRYRLTLPGLANRAGQVRIDRVAANLVWTPVDGFKTGLEASVAWQKLDLGAAVIPAGLGGRQSSLQLFLERTF
ncbi:MAG: hypothetical protein ACK4VM_05670 [Bosea sp. (in: a-proteobacteria)]